MATLGLVDRNGTRPDFNLRVRKGGVLMCKLSLPNVSSKNTGQPSIYRNWTQAISSKTKSKAVPLQAMEALGGEYSSCSFTTSALDGGEWLASRPGRALPQGMDRRYPLERKLVGPQSRSGHRGQRKNPLPLPGIEPRSPGRLARSRTLYCLSYPGS
jgi:hypothetical protein